MEWYHVVMILVVATAVIDLLVHVKLLKKVKALDEHRGGFDARADRICAVIQAICKHGNWSLSPYVPAEVIPHSNHFICVNPHQKATKTCTICGHVQEISIEEYNNLKREEECRAIDAEQEKINERMKKVREQSKGE